MKNRDRSLLRQIEADVLAPETSVTSLLQKCIILGGRAGSAELRDWARKELRGYDQTDTLPEYRKVRAMIALDGLLGFGGQVKNEQISATDLPEFAQNDIDDWVRFYDSIGDIEQLANSTEDHIKLALPGSAELIKMMDAKMGDPYRRITRLYWVVSRASIKGVVEQVRTSLAELVGEMIALMPDNETEPTKDAADQAVGFLISGKRHNVTFVNSQVSGGGSSRVETASDATLKPESWWTRWRKRGLIIGASTVAATAVAIATWLEWTPWN